MIDIQLEGISELSELLTEVAPTAAKRYLSNVAQPAAQVVVDALEQTVPVGIGILEEQIGWQKKWTSEGNNTVMTLNIGPLKPAFWGSFQEFGTRFQPGQHWMARAWESCKDDVLSVFVQGASDMIAKLRAR